MKKKYFNLQLKRVLRLYPTILLVTLLTVISIAVACVVMLQTNSSGDKQKKMTVGVVGNMNDSYLNIGLKALQNMDSSGFYIDWIELSEDEAVKALKKREISGYVYIPENYIENVFNGKNIPAKYVTLNTPEGFGSIVSAEIAETLSGIVIESQIGIYSMQDLSIDYRLGKYSQNTDKLMLEYLDFILDRNDIYKVEMLGIADSLSFGGYYVCGLLLLFMLLWGISCNKIFTSKNNEYSRLLNISGISPCHQVLCEYGAYLVITMSTLCLFAAGFGIILSNAEINIPELKAVGFFDCIMFIFRILPVIMMITLMQSAVYELISNTVAALLMQFVLTIFMGYISGCFYPNYFFPEVLQNISAVLPVGAGFSYIRKSLTGLPSVADFLLVSGYGGFFFFLAYIMKKFKITGVIR